MRSYIEPLDLSDPDQIARVEALPDRVRDGLRDFNNVQKGSGTPEERRALEIEVEDVVLDIAAALGVHIRIMQKPGPRRQSINQPDVSSVTSEEVEAEGRE